MGIEGLSGEVGNRSWDRGAEWGGRQWEWGGGWALWGGVGREM